jgi:hypothetical protein
MEENLFGDARLANKADSYFGLDTHDLTYCHALVPFCFGGKPRRARRLVALTSGIAKRLLDGGNDLNGYTVGLDHIQESGPAPFELAG